MTAGALRLALLAGGMATRMRPLTERVPKSLIEVAGAPFIAHQLHLIASQGVERVVICVGYLGDLIVEFVGDGARFDLRVDFSFDGPRSLGTAGALRKALPLLGDDFFVLYGDAYLPCDFTAVRRAFHESRKAALMTVYRNDDRFAPSNVEMRDGVIVAHDKVRRTERMRYIDYGLGVLSRAAVARVPPDAAYDLTALYQTLLSEGELAAYEVIERFYEIGSSHGLKQADAYLRAAGR